MPAVPVCATSSAACLAPADVGRPTAGSADAAADVDDVPLAARLVDVAGDDERVSVLVVVEAKVLRVIDSGSTSSEDGISALEGRAHAPAPLPTMR